MAGLTLTLTRTRTRTLTLILGKVIRGWEAIAGGMEVGKKVIVKIPPEYAYGKKVS